MHRNALLRQQRIARNWRQQDVADQLGVAVITIQRWERGNQQPSAYYRIKLCTLFGKSAQELGLVDTISPESEVSEAGSQRTIPTKELALWTVPYARNPHFTGRDDLLSHLMQRLSPQEPGQSASTRQIALTQAIKGLGGIGKTQIAVEYAYRAREQGRYTHTIWINAASEEAILASFAALAELLPTFPAKDETDQRKLVTAIIRWLELCEQPWLLIIDNADDLSFISPYLPTQGNGSLLLTTRAHAVGSLASSIEVDTMSVIEGTHLLLRRAQRWDNASDEEINEASNLVVALGQFPLVLDQAGAYIEETGCSVSDYLQIYQQHRHALLARRGRQATQYPASVASTWSLSFQHVEQASPAAAALLHLCAYLSPDHIPEELFTEGAAYWPPTLQEAVADPLRYNQQLETLLAFSLVKRLSDDRMLSLHRLVQVVQIEAMEREEQHQWAERVVCAINAVFPRDPKNEVDTWPQCQRYLEQVQACNSLIQEYQILRPEAADLLDRTGTYLRERVLYPLAEPLYLQALHIREQQLGPDHPDTAQSLNNLALLYYKQGRYTQAEPLYLRALRIREQQLGPDHLDLAYPLHGLANLYHQQDRYVEAAPLFRRALRIREQQLGPDHPQVAYPLNNLALIYYKQGRYEQAEPLYLRALTIREQQLGPDHPDIANSLTLLGLLYYKLGRYEQAEPLFQRALRVREQQLGPDHPDMVYPLINLANLYYQQSKYELAESLALRAQHIAEQQVGPEHLLIAFPLTVLGNLYREQGKYEQAEPLFQWALRVREQQLGPDHSQMAYPQHGLANLYHKQGREAEAEQLYLHALRIREHLLGPEHLETADVLHDFAGFQLARDHITEATHLYQRALTIREHILGADHPLTSDTRRHLYAALVASGQPAEAAMLETRQPEPEKAE
jgi:tetratricopeptide (TPR) repeat protein/transcriptional regulator with XRE-family HTH domain